MTTPEEYLRAAETLRFFLDMSKSRNDAVKLAIDLCERMAKGELVERSALEQARRDLEDPSQYWSDKAEKEPIVASTGEVVKGTEYFGIFVVDE